MDRATIDTLRRVNREFYHSVAEEFSRSRARLQPGLRRVLESWPATGRVLDLGGGNGRFARALVERSLCGSVVVADESRELLSECGAAEGLHATCIDLLEDEWPAEWRDSPFDAVVSFSVLHHIPGRELRQHFLSEMARCCQAGGYWALSVWKVLHRERFRRRRVAWSEIGLREEQVEPGDVLLDWQRGTCALRYVHDFEESELLELCTRSGLHVDEHWRSDGDSGDLGLYVVGHG